MGAFMSSWRRSSSSAAIPDTEFTPCAIMLHRMGYKVVAISFEHGIVTMTPALVATTQYEGYFSVNPYVEERRRDLVATLTSSVPNDVCTLMVSLMSQGLLVIVTTEAKDKYNGDVIGSKSKSSSSSSSKRSAFQYDGPELIRQVLVARLGEDIARHIHIANLDDILHHKKREEILLMHPSHEVIRKARKQHMGGILVDEFKSSIH